MCIDLLAITVGDGRTRPNPKGVEMHDGKMNPLFVIELSRRGWAQPDDRAERPYAQPRRSAPGRVAAWKRLVRVFPPEPSETLSNGHRGHLDAG